MSCACYEVSGTAAAIPVSYAWTWTDATDRLAEAVDISELGLYGYQQDMKLAYQLVNSAGTLIWAKIQDPQVKVWRRMFALNNSTTAPTILGASAFAPVGVAVARNASAGATRATRQIRYGLNTAAGAGSTSKAQTASSDATMNQMVRASGYRLFTSCVLNGVSANMRWCLAGYISVTPAANINPNTLVNWIGIGRGAEANLQIYHNDAAGVSTQIDLGASFPAVTAGEGYELDILTENGTDYAVQVTRVNTLGAFSTTFNTNVPASAEGGTCWYFGNNTDAVAVGVDPVFWECGQLNI